MKILVAYSEDLSDQLVSAIMNMDEFDKLLTVNHLEDQKPEDLLQSYEDLVGLILNSFAELRDEDPEEELIVSFLVGPDEALTTFNAAKKRRLFSRVEAIQFTSSNIYPLSLN